MDPNLTTGVVTRGRIQGLNTDIGRAVRNSYIKSEAETEMMKS